jgi:hypothetical protein
LWREPGFPFSVPLQALKKQFPRSGIPQAAQSHCGFGARLTARVELVPFPFVPNPRVFQQPAKFLFYSILTVLYFRNTQVSSLSFTADSVRI